MNALNIGLLVEKLIIWTTSLQQANEGNQSYSLLELANLKTKQLQNAGFQQRLALKANNSLFRAYIRTKLA